MSFNYTVHTIRPGDTLQKIASLYRCDWQTIATINNLEPPYLVPQDYQREGWAQGIVHLKRVRYITSPITVPKGTALVSVAIDYPLYYYTQEEVTILPEDGVVPVLVRAEAPGATYNLPSESVLQFQDTTLNEYLVVRVPEGFTGGFVKRVKKYGETIYVPTLDAVSTPPDLIRAYGVDIGVDTEQNLMVSPLTNDLTLCGGVDNLIAALSRALTTPKGSYLLHPDYGSNLTKYIGSPLSNDLLQALTIEVRETLLRDPRVEDIRDITVSSQNGDTITISCVVVAKTNLVFPLQVVV